MANLSQIRREQMIAFLEKLKEQHNDDESLIAFNQIEKELTSKKYGLVWEEHEEAVDIKLRDSVPVFTEDETAEICDAEGRYNFLIEGDNLHSLYLLEKTHKGKIDLIYIDPPYNTGNTFIYDDSIVADEDGYKHSKWASFIYRRMVIAKKLLSPKGLCFISIDDKEQAVMRLICDEIFGESRFLTTIAWEKRTKCQNTKTARKMLQPRVEYILVYKNTDERTEFECHVVGEKEYPETDEKGSFRREEVGQMSASGIRGRGSMVFPILGVSPREGNQWKIGLDTVNEFQERGDLYEEKGKVYRKIRPGDESSESIKPFWALFSAEQFGTAESAKKYLSDVLGCKDHEFETVKPVPMIEEIIFQATGPDSIVLDFFAGSGTTAEAVLDANRDYGGNRTFIICTNNENNICRKITYPRLKTIIEGKRLDGSSFGDGHEVNLKLYKTEFVSKDENIADNLLNHIKEMIQLQYGIDIDDSRYVVIMDDDEMDDFEQNYSAYTELQAVFISQDVLLSTSQELLLSNIETFIIPDCYFDFELREAGELW